MIDVLLGLQWGDEGKGKIVDYLAKDYEIIARFQGGPNAGHTLYKEDKKIVLHTVPSGIFHEKIINIIGNGVVIDPVSYLIECNEIKDAGVIPEQKVFISDRAHLIIPTHKALDKANELAKGKEKIGSTLKGIGPTYMDKIGRNGLRVGDILEKDFIVKYEKLKTKHLQLLKQMGFDEEIDLQEKDFFDAIEYLKKFKIIATAYWFDEQLKLGKKILAEGAQGTMLDIDFGTYPFVTSSNTITAGLCTGLGVAPKWVNKVYGISKAYCTRVGSGPFPTELHDEDGEKLRKIGNEFGATTGRPRRCGWIDLVALKYACMINGVSDLIITKADILDEMEHVYVCDAYQIDSQTTTSFPFDITDIAITPILKSFKKWNKKLQDCNTQLDTSEEFKNMIQFIEEFTQTKVSIISNGVGRNQLIEWK
ncbi:MAG: adenylosuccinate synthase [Chitinophagaceae bacterium]